jgi:predicted aspartyl protease
MQSEQLKYRLLFVVILAVLPVALMSFSNLSEEPVCYKSAITSLPFSVFSSQSNTYSPEFKTNADSVIIPMKRAGRLFLIEAKVEDEIGNLVFDTGANGVVLNSTYFRNHIKSGGSSSNGITGSVGVVGQITVSKIEFSELSYKNIRADVANLGHIENRRGVKILGLIGFSLMKDLEIVIDAKNSELKLFRVDKSGKRINNSIVRFNPEYIQKIEGNSNVLFLKGRIGGKTLNFCFDTGAETNAISSDSNNSILNTLTITRRSSLKGVGSAGSEVLFGRMNDFTFGEQSIRDMETIITNLDALSEAYGTRIDGMLGYNFLEQGTVCINFVKKQFGIRFNKGEER